MYMPNTSPTREGDPMQPKLVGSRIGLIRTHIGLIGALGPRGFLYTNMLVSLTPNCRVGGLNQRDGPTQVVLHCSGI